MKFSVFFPFYVGLLKNMDGVKSNMSYSCIWNDIDINQVVQIIEDLKNVKIECYSFFFFFYNLFFFFFPCSGRNWKPPNLINCQIHKRLINWYIERDDVQDYLAYLVVSDIINVTDQIKQSQRPIFIFVCLSVLNIKCITYSKNFFLLFCT